MTTLNLFRSVCLRAPANETGHPPVEAKAVAAPALASHPLTLIQPARRVGASR